MKIFISWSGSRSQAVAQVLRDWLPCVITSVRPWLSTADIDKGAVWNNEIAAQLRESQLGIVCLTPENLTAPWLLFESGALSKSMDVSRVCTYLFDLAATDVRQPLAQFQATQSSKEDTFQLVQTINRDLDELKLEDVRLHKIFERWWPDLEHALSNIPPHVTADSEGARAQRSERELLEEILTFLRSQDRRLAASDEIAESDVTAYIDSLNTALRAARRADTPA